jgi:hypothetical protein
LIDLIIDPSHNLKRTKIEPFIIPKEKLDELKAIREDPTSPEIRKNTMMRRYTGSCHSCGQRATQIAKYRMYGASIIEKYCDECLRRIQT